MMPASSTNLKDVFKWCACPAGSTNWENISNIGQGLRTFLIRIVDKTLMVQ